jgi:hypothetical protein
MNIDRNFMQQLLEQGVSLVLNHVQYPVNKHTLIDLARRFHVSEHILGMMEHLPDTSFNSAQEVQNALEGLGFGKHGEAHHQ